MGILTHAMTQPCKIITTVTNGYGDQKKTAEVSTLCRFRYISELDKNTNREGLDTADAMVWLEPDTNITEASILFIDNAYWRVYRLIKARKMSGDEIEFIKVLVNAHSLSNG